MTGRTSIGDGAPAGATHRDQTTANHPRTGWPWHSAPVDCTDYDAAVWYACRRSSGGTMPRQDLESWVQRQRASRDVWAFPRPMTVADRAQLLVDLAAAWEEHRDLDVDKRRHAQGNGGKHAD